MPNNKLANFMSQGKKELRTRFLKLRDELPKGYRDISSRAIVTHVLSLVARDVVVAGYCAIRGEIDISTLMKVMAERGNTLCLPVVVTSTEKTSLTFRRWQPGDLLVEDIYKIKVPAQSAPAVTPEVLLVPLVAFDAAGQRLGYGAGYYDRTIIALKKQNQKLKTIGIAYSQQQAEKIPADEGDEKLDVIVTEKGVIQPA